MNILIVEDDSFKARQLYDAVIDFCKDAIVVHVTSLQDAIDVLYQDSFNAILLDMAIPSHSDEGGSSDVYSQPVGGLDVLLYLSYDQRPEKVMVLTQYPTIEYNRQHVPLAKFSAQLEADGVRNLTSLSFFGEDGFWRERLNSFLGSVI